MPDFGRRLQGAAIACAAPLGFLYDSHRRQVNLAHALSFRPALLFFSGAYLIPIVSPARQHFRLLDNVVSLHRSRQTELHTGCSRIQEAGVKASGVRSDESIVARHHADAMLLPMASLTETNIPSASTWIRRLSIP